MNLRTELLREHSKAVAQSIADHVLEHHEVFDELMEIFLTEKYRLIQRASWPIGLIGDQHPEWFLSYFPQLLECLAQPKHDAVSRSIYRTLQFMDIPEEYESVLYDQCLKDLSNPKTAIAIKVFGMTVAANIAQKYPEMHEELALSIEQQLPYSSVGYASRARKILKKLRKP